MDLVSEEEETKKENLFPHYSHPRQALGLNSAREDSVKVRRGDKRVLHHNENEIRWTARSEKEQWERS